MKAPIQTARLHFVPFDQTDLPVMTALVNDREVSRMMCSFAFPFTPAHAQSWWQQKRASAAKGDSHLFAIRLQGQGLIGIIGMDRKPDQLFNLGYWLGKPFWGKGYASEAASSFINWAETERNVKAITADFFADNPSSERVLAKTGFLRTGVNEKMSSLARQTDTMSIGMIWLGQTAHG
ncbi:hypothetical protein MNBD_ALPHA06-1687 [hydrothermal vent metagenome]|uniref:N-acetyltransferase domain-containing protein n=1 Tax=hydrothermal vent metagenome TaxID=652676 RepID=A0A3B0RT75_9ZZZZ